ncbi:MAG TPA: LysR family transcriptional regulator [Accumulibacter sp.]|uniref:LysR family transcriptional regulator n=1 Tax=Accumulibacter sp. TaxID=2053492 RepID=UPI00261C4D6E|nr:LysR family transcriptional regulator [Accumulibacter sp.]MDS4054233.1 LysR family transcriptional regulator [Accumulibacter sp.]HMV04338.1 LysR family transcriptional regulator [Accumulibacter sp.]HMW65149.1 LysR family transcriptional regulator [Accumulibacter sp.]HMW79978.1 LysR family transcriptional regulator [Accumulibacter sp.]HMX67781.1 LysR family transcriptional regulator [Accumulibacter sp.]
MRNATIRQLQIFAVAASHLSFARAAETLHLTHAAISLQIKQLEEVSGIPLFERIGKRVFLTEAGEILLDRARQILQLLKETDEALLALKGLKGGRIAVAVVSTAEYFAPGLLAEFRRRQPDVVISLRIDNRTTVNRLLVGNEVDLAIMGRPPAELDATAIAFAPHPLVIVASADHRLRAAHSIAVEELAGETLIVRETGSGTRSAMEQFFHDHSIRPRIGMEMSSNEAIKQAVVAGLGISFISQHTLGLELSSKRLHILKVEGTPVMRRWHLVRHRSKHLTPALAAFWAFLLEYAPDYLKRLG